MQLATAVPNFLAPVDSACTKWLTSFEDIITKPFEYENDTLTVPGKPGLCIEIYQEKYS